MFLIERLFGVACYSAALALIFITIFYRKLRVKDALIFYVIILSVFAYFYEPYETADLFRIINIMEQFSVYDLESFSKLTFADNTTPVAYWLYWLIGRIGNPGLLPAFATVMTYSITFYILYKSSKIYSIGNKSIAIILLFVMSTGNYIMVISNIRTMLAISLICFCFFRESILKSFRIWHILLYVLAALTHNLAIILIIIRFAAFVFSSHLRRKWKIIIMLFLTAVSVIIIVFFNWVLDSVFDKAVEYITGEMYSYIWEYIIGLLVLTIEVSALFYKKNTKIRLKENTVYFVLCIIVACVFINEFSIFYRMIVQFATILTIPLLASGFSMVDIKSKQSEVFYLSLLMLFIACFRGSLSSLKFFVL